MLLAFRRGGRPSGALLPSLLATLSATLLRFSVASSDVFTHLAEYAERFFILREEDAKEEDRDRYGQDLFGSEGNPEKREIATGKCLHPPDPEEDPEREQDVAPAVRDHPRNEETKEKPGVQNEPHELLYPFLDFFLRLLLQMPHGNPSFPSLLEDCQILCYIIPFFRFSRQRGVRKFFGIFKNFLCGFFEYFLTLRKNLFLDFSALLDKRGGKDYNIKGWWDPGLAALQNFSEE